VTKVLTSVAWTRIDVVVAASWRGPRPFCEGGGVRSALFRPIWDIRDCDPSVK
jgi:hypothetical protein